MVNARKKCVFYKRASVEMCLFIHAIVPRQDEAKKMMERDDGHIS